jgi:hypothetical protein
VECPFQASNRLHQNTEIRSVRARFDETPTNEHDRAVRDLIDLTGIGGEIALNIRSKTVIYSVIKNTFLIIQNFRVITVGRLDRATASEPKWSVVTPSIF